MMVPVIAFLVLMLLCAAVGAYATFSYLSNHLAEQESSVQGREYAVQQKWKEIEAQRRELEQAKAAEIARQQRQLAAIKAAEAMLYRGEPADTSHAGVSQYQRHAFRQGALVGEYVRVIYLLSTDGFLTFRWEIDWPESTDPLLQITRDHSVIRTDCGRNGEHKDHVRPGRYTYKFSVHDPQARNRQVGQMLIAEIVVPVPEVWNNKPPGTPAVTLPPPKKERPGQRVQKLLEEKVGTFVAAERAVGKMRQEVEKALRKQGLAEDDIEHRMSRLDGRIAEIREDIGA